MTKENIQLSFGGKLWIKGRRQKTDTEYNIPFLNIPMMILEKYEKWQPDNQLLPVGHLQAYNGLLKQVAKVCGIDKNMSSHIARHTFAATIALTKGVPIETASKMLGHTSIKTTQIYAKVIKRKISHNQVRAIRIMLSGSLEEMKRIEETGRLGDWCQDNVDWLRKTFGNENLVSAVLHLDEKTPHIHATVVPIVQGERRKAKTEKDNDRKKYKKKPANSARLCADDVMARNKLKAYLDSYAETMLKYGLHRGVEGSAVRHASMQQFYRDLHLQNETLKEDIEDLTEQKQEVYGKVRDMYDQKDEAQEKFLAMDKYPVSARKHIIT